MNETKNKIAVAPIDFAIGAAVIAALLVCHVAGMFGLQIQALAACTGAVMCVQDGKKASWGAGMNRLLGVICGGVTGIVVVLIDNLIHVDLIFYLLVGVGVVANLLLCRAVKLPMVQARVSCMSLMLVTLVLQGGARINYAFGRLIGTLVGAVVALLVSMAFAAIVKKEK